MPLHEYLPSKEIAENQQIQQYCQDCHEYAPCKHNVMNRFGMEERDEN